MDNVRILSLIRDVIENEHGGKVYDADNDTYITPPWDEWEYAIHYASMQPWYNPPASGQDRESYSDEQDRESYSDSP